MKEENLTDFLFSFGAGCLAWAFFTLFTAVLMNWPDAALNGAEFTFSFFILLSFFGLLVVGFVGDVRSRGKKP